MLPKEKWRLLRVMCVCLVILGWTDDRSGWTAKEVSPNAFNPHYFSATFRPFCAVFSPFFRGFRLPGAKTERTGEKWRKMGEIWGRNGREIAVAK